MKMTPKNSIERPNCKDAKTILLLGSSGFIGRQVVKQLSNKGYILRTPSRKEIDFVNPNWEQIGHWIEGIDVVINMIGVMSNDMQILGQVHHYAPVALAKLAKRFHVKHWINLSALGANPNHEVAFVASKGRGDNALLALADESFNVSIARPSLVFGRGGASCEMFLNLANLPITILPNGGKQKVQPVHVMDVAQGLVNLALTTDSNQPSIINFTGSDIATLTDYITMMRTQIHKLSPPTILSVPNLIAKSGISLFSPILPKLFKEVVSQDSLILLNEESIADCQRFTALLKRHPLSYDYFGAYY